MTVIKVMRQDAYDANADGATDKANGILVLAEIPTDLSAFADGDMFKVGSRIYVVNK